MQTTKTWSEFKPGIHNIELAETSYNVEQNHDCITAIIFDALRKREVQRTAIILHVFSGADELQTKINNFLETHNFTGVLSKTEVLDFFVSLRKKLIEFIKDEQKDSHPRFPEHIRIGLCDDDLWHEIAIDIKNSTHEAYLFKDNEFLSVYFEHVNASVLMQPEIVLRDVLVIRHHFTSEKFDVKLKIYNLENSREGATMELSQLLQEKLQHAHTKEDVRKCINDCMTSLKESEDYGELNSIATLQCDFSFIDKEENKQ